MGQKRKAVTKDTVEANVTARGAEFQAILQDEMHSSMSSTNGEDEFISRTLKDDIASPRSDSSLWEDMSLSQNADTSSTSLKVLKLGVNYRIGKDVAGNARYIYDEIDPVYDSDDSDALATSNNIGDIPMSFYDSYPHIGYDIDGKKVMRPAKGEALETLLDSIDLPTGWTGLTDPKTGQSLALNEEELRVLKRVTRNEIPVDGYDPYPDLVEYFSGIPRLTPLSAAPEPKRRFVPSKYEAKRVTKIAKAIKEGRIRSFSRNRDSETERDVEEKVQVYDIWADETQKVEHAMHIPAPKPLLPDYGESYHPPPEYLPDEAERKEWDVRDPEEGKRPFLPKDHDSLRRVAAYDNFVKEKFERCLDLYLAPRVRRTRPEVDPESLLPKLPDPQDLKPFPSTCATIYHGHTGRVRTVSINSAGTLLATGGDDGTVRIWELLTGWQLWSTKLSNSEAVTAVKWRPDRSLGIILSAVVGENVYLIIPLSLVTPQEEQKGREILDAGFGYSKTQSREVKAKTASEWRRPGEQLQYDGVLLFVSVRSNVKTIDWHRRGDYFVTVSPQGQRSAIAIHTLSKHMTQIPFRKLKGLPQTAKFHPAKPVLFVALQQTVRSYDLMRQELDKKLQPGARWISCLDVHPGGDNVLVGSYDRRLLWHDLDLSSRPYKTLRYHNRAIRAVRFHQGGQPLFADASDDGTVQIFHGRVVSDLMENATVVPLKVLRGHSVQNELGVLDVDWHPREPWLISAGADGTCRLWN